jgi:hypothetical protein
MIVYRSGESTAPTEELLRRIRSLQREIEASKSPAYENAQKLLLDYGEFEAGVADAICGEANGATHVTRALRCAALRAGHVFLRSWRQQEQQGWVERLGASLAEIAALELPLTIRVAMLEGYAYYGLYPEMYAAAAEEFARGRESGEAVVIGIRSIGASLSGVVEATLQSSGWKTHSYTVRPGGHPFDRTLRVSAELGVEWRASGGSHFLIVDEGPGMSGSSFASVAQALASGGIARERIVFFPSWDADGSSFINKDAAEEWSKHSRYTANFEEVGPLSAAGLHDISAGKWRGVFCDNERVWPAVQPRHEARKYLRGGLLLKFAGLGRYGERKLELARALSNEGFTPAVAGLSSGFLANKVASGFPVLLTAQAPRELIARAAVYLAWRKKNLPRRRSISFDGLVQLIQVNAVEAIGAAPSDAWFSGMRREIDDREATAVDGRMLPQEWIDTPAGYLKTDAVDHHADHFYPGDADIAWDLAAAAIEFRLDASARRFLMERYRSISGDRVSESVLQFYEVAWLAFRAGYTAMACSSMAPGAERDRFDQQRRAYARLLRGPILKRQEKWLVSA